MLGIVAADLFALPRDLLWGVALLGLAGTFLVGNSPPLRFFSLALLVVALGGVRYEPVDVARSRVTIWRLAAISTSEIMVQGVVSTEPGWTDSGQQVTLETEAASLGETAAPVSGLLLLSLPPYPAYHYGEHLVAVGAVEEPPAARQPNTFNYRAYLARKHIFATMHEPAVYRLPDTRGNPLLVGLLRFRSHCHALLLRALPEPQASVAGGMLLGLKAAIPDETYTTFAANGVAHILVISGWHLSLVASIITSSAARLRLGRGATFWVSLAAIWVYAMFVGATATVLRAALMASLVVLARATERQGESWTLLLAACWFLSLWNPHILWDLGFQLSVLATASLVAFTHPVRGLLERFPPLRWPLARWITEPLSVTLAAQILVLPLVLYHFGNLSLISPLSNVLLVPVVPAIMLLSGAALLLSLLSGLISSIPLVGSAAALLAQGVWLFAWLPLAYLTEGARLLATLPGAALRLPQFSPWLLAAYYGVAALWLLRKRRAA
jgi:competence protein ComEC